MANSVEQLVAILELQDPHHDDSMLASEVVSISELRFVIDLAIRAVRIAGDRMNLTDKQADWLTAIHGRTLREIAAIKRTNAAMARDEARRRRAEGTLRVPP